MSILGLVNGKRGVETACYAVYSPKDDKWLTSVWEGAECLPLFETESAATAQVDGMGEKAMVKKVAPSDMARLVTSMPGPVRGLLLIAASGVVQKVILKDAVN